MFKSQKIKDKDKPAKSQRGGVRQGWGSMLVRKTRGNKIRNHIILSSETIQAGIKWNEIFTVKWKKSHQLRTCSSSNLLLQHLLQPVVVVTFKNEEVQNLSNKSSRYFSPVAPPYKKC